jgi:hypothetical protein
MTTLRRHPPLIDILKKLGRPWRDLLDRGRAEAHRLMARDRPTESEEERVVAFDTAFWEHPMHRVIRRVSELSGLDSRDVERVAFGLVEGLGRELAPYTDALQTISKRTRLDLLDVGEAAYRVNSNLGLAPLDRVKKPALRDLQYLRALLQALLRLCEQKQQALEREHVQCQEGTNGG